ncbi:condensation domain-containing protein [Streptomyces sp. NPDC029721]|uniref:condensation domain-containing protein n=1 Tax=Streptomyces sp. NPDC029721 TaxID=3157090 RepID=UPI003404247F
MTGRPGDGRRRAPASRALAAPRPRIHPAAPLQVDVLLDGLTHPGRGLHAGQLHWRLPGPFDAERFTRAWQTVTDQETVLRTGLAPAAPGTRLPGFAVHPAAGPLIVRHPAGGVEWEALLAAERMREFDLTRPDPLRIALLEEPGGSARVLLTYHRAFLDPASAEHLVRSFHRAHAADGRPRGGERRPDLRDHLQWVGARDRAPARAFWADAAPPEGSATLPAGDRGRPTHQRGHGRTRQRLTPVEAARLRAWAASRGAAESTALQAVWALLLYRAHGGPEGAAESVPVAFAAAVSGRGIPLDGADRLPGPLLGALPVAVEVRPAGTLAELLAALAARAVDLAAYEWVSAGEVHRWSGRDPYAPLTESVLAFLPPPQPRPTPRPRPAGRLPAGAAGEPVLPAGPAVESPFAEGPSGEPVSPAGPSVEGVAPSGPSAEPPFAEGPSGEPVSPAGPSVEGVSPVGLSAEPPFAEGPLEEPGFSAGPAVGGGIPGLPEPSWPSGEAEAGPVESCEAYTGTPLALTARHDADGGLLLTLVHDRTRIADSDAAEILWQTTRLLRGLPADAGPGATVARALRLLDGAPVPLAAARPDPALRTLRPGAAPGSGLVCLLRPPGVPEDCYEGVAHGLRGTRALLSVAPWATAALTALAPALAAGEPVVLGGYPEVADLAHQVAGRVAAYGWGRPPVAVAATDAELAEALTAAARRRP